VIFFDENHSRDVKWVLEQKSRVKNEKKFVVRHFLFEAKLLVLNGKSPRVSMKTASQFLNVFSLMKSKQE